MTEQQPIVPGVRVPARRPRTAPRPKADKPVDPPRRRRPKKYAPREVSPEWLEWAREEAMRHCLALGVHPSWYFAEDYDKQIADEGAWIIVLDPPHVQLTNDFQLPRLSMWRATRFDGAHLARDLPFRFQQAVINTPGGTVHLWPTEYTIIDDITQFVGQEPNCTLHSLGGQPVLDEDQMFYLMSRGVSRQDAALLLIGQVTATDFAYFTFSKEYQDLFAGVGIPLNVLRARADSRKHDAHASE